MTIEFKCQQCDNSLRVGDENAGKTSRCPRCGTPNVVPVLAGAGAEFPVVPAETTPVVPVHQPQEPEKRFFVESDVGQTYGPVTLIQLDQWVTEGRVTAQYVIREEGGQGGFYASQMYPALAESPAAPAQSSYPAPAYPQPPNDKSGRAAKVSGHDTSVPIVPTQIAVSDALDHAFVVFKNNLGLLLGTTVTISIVNLASNRLLVVSENMNDQALATLLLMGSILADFISVFLFIGQAQICLKLARGFEADYMDLFGAGVKFIYVSLFGLLIGIVGFILLTLIFLVTHFFSPVFGTVIAAVLIFAAWLSLWPAYFLLVDGKANVFSCFSKAAEIATPNLGSTLIIFLVSIGLTIAGVLAFCVGVLFSSAFVAVLWATAYLLMSGQLQTQKYG